MSGTACYAAELCRIYVLLLLGAASVGKALAPAAFARSLADFLPLGPRAARAAATVVFATEAAIALLLLAGGRLASAGMAAAFLLFAAFGATIGTALARGRTVSCNCFGSGARRISRYDMVRNGILLAACAFYLLHPIQVAVIAPVGWTLLGLAALILILVTGNLDEIAALAR